MANNSRDDGHICSDDIIAALAASHKKDIKVEELRLSSGFAMQGRIDFWAISPSPAAGNLATSYEVKISRGDFRKDSHKKQRGARLFSDRIFYVAPEGIIPHEEVPDWAGLIEATWATKKWINNGEPTIALRTVITAPKLDKEAPSWGLVVSLLRNNAKDSSWN